MAKGLRDRLIRYEQKQALHEQSIARLQDKKRRARVSHLISLGALVEKAGLATRSTPTGSYDELVALERRIAKRGRDARSGKPSAPEHSPDPTEEIPSSDDDAPPPFLSRREPGGLERWQEKMMKRRQPTWTA